MELKLTNAKSIEHIRQTAIVHAASVPEASWGGPGVDHYAANSATDPNVTAHPVKVPNLSGRQILAAWYTVHDRVHGVANFEIIHVYESSATEVKLEAKVKASAPPEFLRIAIHLLVIGY
jgi:hypothetical protein